MTMRIYLDLNPGGGGPTPQELDQMTTTPNQDVSGASSNTTVRGRAVGTEMLRSNELKGCCCSLKLSPETRTFSKNVKLD